MTHQLFHHVQFPATLLIALSLYDALTAAFALLKEEKDNLGIHETTNLWQRLTVGIGSQEQGDWIWRRLDTQSTFHQWKT